MGMDDIKNIKFSVAMSIYKNDDPEQLKVALDSICDQSVPPSEIFVVRDGPVGDDLKNVIDCFCRKYPGLFTIWELEKNGGLGNALNIAVLNCKYDIIARMDSDDISMPGRFEKQLRAFVESDVDVLGGWTVGFFGDLSEGSLSTFNPKLTNEELHKQIGIRTPVSHVTAMFKRESVLSAGNYLDLFYHEDYYLWARMMKGGCKFMNIPEYLVFVRCGDKAAARHGGIKYFHAERFLRSYLLKNKLCTFFTYITQMAARFIYELLLPAKLRVVIDKRFKRKFLSRGEADCLLSKLTNSEKVSTDAKTSD